ncbi:MAG: hypothetical protein QXP20_06875, partial [Candidatus Bathyarchaeia archaeon]
EETVVKKKLTVKDLEARVAELRAKLTKSIPESEAEALKQRIRELEANMTKYKEKMEVTKTRNRELEGALLDLESKLKDIIGEAGKVSPEYGGYEIIVLNPSNFPWCNVLTLLLDNSLEVWVTKKGEHTVILCKPSSV